MFKKVHVFRVKPGRELVEEITRFCREKRLTSGIVLGIVGSAEKARISFLEKLPAHYKPLDFSGPMEIVAAQGSVALLNDETVLHIHIQCAVENACWGGHLVAATVFSTAEVTIGELDYQLYRQLDSYTGLNELRRDA